MADQVVIQIDAEIGPGLTKALDILEKLGVVSKKDADAFRALNASGKEFAAGQNVVQKELSETEKGLAGVAAQSQKAGAALKNTGTDTGLKNAKKDVDGLSGALKGLAGQVVAAFAVQQVVQFGKEAANLSAKFNSIKTAINFVQGGAEQGGKAFDFLTDLAERLGLELVSTAQAFKLFSASSQLAGIGADETKDIFESVATATTTLGLTAEDTNGVFLALSQIISKGTVQAEELRGQIGERLPGAFELAAKSMGVTTQQLNKMLEQGQVLSKDFLPKFAAELKNTFSGGLEAAAQGAQANLNRITNAFTNFKVAIGDIINANIAAGFKLFSDSQEEAIQKSGDLARANRANATSAKNLLQEYESLTKSGVTPNAEQKARLKDITYQLRDALGASVVNIDKETGALILNKDAVREAIKQKLLLANQEASTLALRLDAANQQKAAAELTKKTLNDERELLESKAKAAGLDVKNLVLSNDFTKEQIDLFGKLDNLQVKEADNKIKLKKIEDERVLLLRQLKDLNFNEADIKSLFGDTDEIDGDVKKIVKSIATLEVELADFQKQLKNLEDSDATLPQRQKLFKDIEFTKNEIARLSGKLNKKASDKELSEREKALQKLHELERKAFEDNLTARAKEIDEVIQLEQEKHLRLQELVEQFAKATGADLNAVLAEFDKTGRIDLSEVFSSIENFKAPEGEMEKFSKAIEDVTEKFKLLQDEIIQTGHLESLKGQFKDAFDFIEDLADQAALDIDSKFTNEKIELIAEFKMSGQTAEDFQRLQAEFTRIDKERQKEHLDNEIKTVEAEIRIAERANEQSAQISEEQVAHTKALYDKRTKLINEANEQQVEDFEDGINAQMQALDEWARRNEEIIGKVADISRQFLSLVGDSVNNYYDAQAEKISENTRLTLESYDEQAEALDKLHEKNRIGDRQYEQSKDALLARRKAEEKRADRELKKLKREQAEYNKAVAIAEAVVNTAVAVTANLAFPPVAAAIAILGAAEIAVIASEPIPAFAKGVEKVKGKGTETSDEVPARLSVGERVVTASTNRKFFPILSAIHREKFDPEILNSISRFTHEDLRLLVKTDKSILRELATSQPVFLKHTPIPETIMMRRDLVQQLTQKVEVKHTIGKDPGALNQHDIRWAIREALGSGMPVSNPKDIAKAMKDELRDSYASHRK